MKNGIVVIDKPVGRSSAFIARIVGKKLGASKMGHLGTLDPFASGVLPIALDNATRLIHYIEKGSKTYDFEIVFGNKTDTGDVTGTVVETSTTLPTLSELSLAVPRFLGTIEQIPPKYSAIKISGRKAYELARRGKEFEVPKREVTIHSLEILKQTSENSYLLRADVSPGTYIRTLAEDIAYSMNTVAYVKTLRRIKDGQFTIENSFQLDQLNEDCYNRESVVIDITDLLVDIPVAFVSKDDAVRLVKGLPCESDRSENSEKILVKSQDGFMFICDQVGNQMFPRRLVNCFFEKE